MIKFLIQLIGGAFLVALATAILLFVAVPSYSQQALKPPRPPTPEEQSQALTEEVVQELQGKLSCKIELGGAKADLTRAEAKVKSLEDALIKSEAKVKELEAKNKPEPEKPVEK